MSDTTDSTEQMHVTPDADGRDVHVNDCGGATFWYMKIPSWRLCSMLPRLHWILRTPRTLSLSASCSGWKILSHWLPASGHEYRTTRRKRWAMRSTAISDTLTTKSTWLARRARTIRKLTTSDLKWVASSLLTMTKWTRCLQADIKQTTSPLWSTPRATQTMVTSDTMTTRLKWLTWCAWKVRLSTTSTLGWSAWSFLMVQLSASKCDRHRWLGDPGGHDSLQLHDASETLGLTWQF